MALSIYLAKLNRDGITAEIIDEDEDDQLEIFSNYVTDDVEFMCRHAADRLRLLADAFDCLATMSDPFKEKTQQAAMAAAKQARRDGVKDQNTTSPS
jgi:hypothetical protein